MSYGNIFIMILFIFVSFSILGFIVYKLIMMIEGKLYKGSDSFYRKCKNVRSNYVFKPKTRDELHRLIRDGDIYLGFIDVRNVTDMSNLFEYTKVDRKYYNGIEFWDVSKVTNMSKLFEDSYFNEDITHWDVSNVKNMSFMFSFARCFDRDIEPVKKSL